jgi:TetR/AcrR family transcriptional repressor of bet genes
MGRPSLRAGRRAGLTAAFARVVARRGHAGATIAAVAEEAGVAPGLVHHHFADKADLVDSLLDALVTRFRWRTSAGEAGGKELATWLAAALALDAENDHVEARCWVAVLAEGAHDPRLAERIRRLIGAEIEALQRRSGGRCSPEESGALLAYVLGGLALGAFAPRRVAGFAAPAAKVLARAFATPSSRTRT